MADYAIGDIQGCFDALMRLLTHLSFNDSSDRLWFVGDLVNRGPQSLAVLRFVKALPIPPIITLGNHDLYCLSRLFLNHPAPQADDTLADFLNADDRFELGHWLRRQSILHYDSTLNVVMCHAGIAPIWTLQEAITHASELEYALHGDHYQDFLTHMYGNMPNQWSPTLTHMEKLRLICNYFTRMRFCDEQGRLILTYKGTIDNAPSGIYPWFTLNSRHKIGPDIVFGHWAALQGKCFEPGIHAIDTGCLWGGQLTALRLQDMQRFAVPG